MEMSIAAMSMSMAAQNTQNAVAIGLMKKTMEQTEQQMAAITEMLGNIPSPDGRGLLLSTRA